jgi:CHASE3 domain sensor protein
MHKQEEKPMTLAQYPIWLWRLAALAETISARGFEGHHPISKCVEFPYGEADVKMNAIRQQMQIILKYIHKK